MSIQISNENINFILEQYGDIADYYDMNTGYTYLISVHVETVVNLILRK